VFRGGLQAAGFSKVSKLRKVRSAARNPWELSVLSVLRILVLAFTTYILVSVAPCKAQFEAPRPCSSFTTYIGGLGLRCTW
jgi:hypothetical protein